MDGVPAWKLSHPLRVTIEGVQVNEELPHEIAHRCSVIDFLDDAHHRQIVYHYRRDHKVFRLPILKLLAENVKGDQSIPFKNGVVPNFLGQSFRRLLGLSLFCVCRLL